ncbi:uncharacterized protein LOC129801879 isoform X2 [Phlebotomus papatasi]|nr:uncharacterized protein LOC129801879 isoform X2 [Phlebotomus papatasi]
MDEDEGNALEEFSAELEEHLYSKIHHGQVESVMKTDAPPSAPGGSQKGRNGRYFAQGGTSGRPFGKKFAKRTAPILGIDRETQPEGGKAIPKFTPYQSFLQGIKMGSESVRNPNLRKNPAKLFRKPPVPEAPSQSKREKKKNRRKDKKKPETIVLDSSDDEKDDDVVEVPVPSPPLVCLDSSDESQQDGMKKSPRKRQVKSTRGSSPSSSILSDDFIAAKDRKRLAESMETIHMADDELRTVQQQSKPTGNAQKRSRAQDSESTEGPKEHFSDISTSDSEDFLPDQESSPKHRYRKRKRLPPSPKETPYILKGEALPNAVTVPKRKSIDLSSSHRSDEEFITILSSIANGDTSNSQNPGNSDDDPVEIVSAIPGDETSDILLNISTQGDQNSEEESEAEKKSEAEGSGQEDEEQSAEGEEEEEEEEAQGEESEQDDKELEEDNLPRLTHGWNAESRRFYEDSWGGENFSVKKILDQMPANSHWQISARDFNFSRFHRTWREPQEMKLVCYMCGESGHREPRCPNTLCLRCGNRAMVFGIACGKCSDWPSRICEICQTKGHKKELCPDTWRRYHSTLEGSVPVEVKECLNDRKYCSMCAKKGHMADSCPCPVRILEYPVSPWRVSSYEAVYEASGNVDNPKDPFHTYRGERMQFAWSESVKKSQFYQRFLDNCNIEASKGESSKEPEPVEEQEMVDVEEASRIQTDNAESKLYLDREYCERLLAPRGKQVLMSLADDLTVEVNLRSSQSGNLLKLRGERGNIESFKKTLMRFLSKVDKSPVPSPDGQMDEVQNIPRNRIKMIRFLRKKLQLLLGYIGDATALNVEMGALERKCTSMGMLRRADALRIRLNMILLGQAGLLDGKMHLRAIEQDLMTLEKQEQCVQVPPAIRNNIFLHFK